MREAFRLTRKDSAPEAGRLPKLTFQDRSDSPSRNRIDRTAARAPSAPFQSRGEEMAIRDWGAEYWRVVGRFKNPYYLLGGLVVVVAIAVGLAFLLWPGSQSQVPVSAAEEPCETESGGHRVGYVRTILLCSMDSRRCNPDQTQVFRAQSAGNWSTQALLIDDIPDGYVIRGGDVIDPSMYRISNVGFGRIKITNYTNSNDYCTQHYWYYLSANHISPDPEDRIRIKVCVYYDKWQGKTETCPKPTANAP